MMDRQASVSSDTLSSNALRELRFHRFHTSSRNSHITQPYDQHVPRPPRWRHILGAT